ncbi:YqaJ viral recombinase family protein [Gordonia caeni]|uniref:YqaJ viral recombinase domain-containing protein n=1 Tax=Gordonia caeni TaxID=1007097 RepID=A0ABP7PDS1_9ACTN
MIAPGSPEWLRLITPSKVPAILGVSRWQSQYALWHQMAGRLERSEPKAAQQDDFDYGHAAELAAAEYWRYKNPGWRISRGEVQFTNPHLPFEHVATIDRRASRGRGRRVVEIKTARDLAEYGDDGTGAVPQDYAAQILTQMLITGWHRQADVVLWPQYGKPRIYQVGWDADVAAVIVDRCTAWVESLAAGTPPDLDDSVSCYEAVRALHPDIDGSTVEIDPDLAVRYLALDAEKKDVEQQARAAKTRLLDAMGTARIAAVGGVKIADRRPARNDQVALYPATKNLELLQENAA